MSFYKGCVSSFNAFLICLKCVHKSSTSSTKSWHWMPGEIRSCNTSSLISSSWFKSLFCQFWTILFRHVLVQLMCFENKNNLKRVYWKRGWYSLKKGIEKSYVLASKPSIYHKVNRIKRFQTILNHFRTRYDKPFCLRECTVPIISHHNQPATSSMNITLEESVGQ